MSGTGSKEQNDNIVNIAYSLPHVLATSIESSFDAYFYDLYINTFGWSAEEFGKVTSLFNFTQFFSYIILGVVFKYVVEGNTRDRTDKEKLRITKWITFSSIFIYALTYLLFVLVPLGFTDVRIGFIDKLFRINPPIASQDVGKSMSGSAFGAGYNYPGIDPFSDIVSNSEPGSRFNSALRFVKSGSFLIYIIAIFHGLGISTFELCSYSMPTYIYKEEKNIESIETISMTFFTGANFLAIMVITFGRYFFSRVLSDVDFFLLLALFTFSLQIPIMWFFLAKADKPEAIADAPENRAETRAICSNIQSESSCPKISDNIGFDLCKLIALTTFYGTGWFWNFTAGPLIDYTSTFILAGNANVKNFGLIVNLVGFAGISIIHTILTHFEITDCNDTEGKSVMSTCIIGQALTFLLFFPHDWSWNTSKWFQFLILLAMGAGNSLFLTYYYVMLDKVLSKNNISEWKWMVIGGILATTNLVDSFSSYQMYKGLDHDLEIGPGSSSTYLFPTVYVKITILFQIANIIAVCLYYLEDVIEYIKKSFSIDDSIKPEYREIDKKLELSLNSLDQMLQILNSIQ